MLETFTQASNKFWLLEKRTGDVYIASVISVHTNVCSCI